MNAVIKHKLLLGLCKCLYILSLSLLLQQVWANDIWGSDYTNISSSTIDTTSLYQNIMIQPPQKTGLGNGLFVRGHLTDTEGLSEFNDPFVIQENLARIHYIYTAQDFMDYHNLQNIMNLSVRATPEIQRERQQSFDHANKVLALFLQKYPDLITSIESSAGIGLFEASSINLILYAGGWGGGMVFDKVNHTVIYVDTFRAGTGLGLGYIDDYILIIFKNHFAIEQYFGTGGAGGDVGGSATVGIWSHAMSFNPMIATYHLYNYGANIQANWGGTLYWSSPTLN